MANGLLILRDEAAIPHFDRAEQGDGTVCYFFCDTTIRVIEVRTEGSVRLIPVSGDQVACGEWVELDEAQVRRYCNLLNQHLNSGHKEEAVKANKFLQEDH